MLSVALMSQALTGCGGASEENQAASADTAAEKPENAAAAEKPDQADTSSGEGSVSLTVLCGYAGEDPHGQYVYQYADAYMEEHPGVTIEIQAISTNDIYTKLSAMATTPPIRNGDPPCAF